MRVARLVHKRPTVDTDKSLPIPWLFTGVELEYNNFPWARKADLPNAWEAVTEYSCGDNGGELIFRDPLRGRAVVNALRDLHYSGLLSDVSVDMETSNHIHLDMLSLSLTQLSNVVLMFFMLEGLLFKDAKRKLCPFCPQLRDRHNSILAVKHLMVRSPSTELLAALESVDKYTSVNFYSIIEKGSIEVRTFSSSANIMDILNNIRLVQLIIKLALEFKYRIPCEHILDSITLDRIALALRPLGVVEAMTPAELIDFKDELTTRAFILESA